MSNFLLLIDGIYQLTLKTVFDIAQSTYWLSTAAMRIFLKQQLQ